MSQLFLDIETVCAYRPDAYGIVSDMPAAICELYGKRFKKDIEGMQSPNVSFMEALNDHYVKNAALYAEFGKIICIGLGGVEKGNLKTKAIYGDNEKELLTEFVAIASKCSSMVAQNGLEFDYPWIVRRCWIHGIPVPNVLNTIGKKPWEVNLEDTQKMWSGTAWNYRCGLSLMAELFGLPSPKDDLDGSEVGPLYYSEDPERLPKIAKYCIGDVVTLANVYHKMKGLPIFQPNQIIYQ